MFPRADLADERTKQSCRYLRHPTQIHAVKPPGGFKHREPRTILADIALALRSFRQRTGHLAFHPGGQFAELFIARRDGFAQLPVGSLALPEHEQVFLTVVAAQSFDDLLGTAAAALVPQGGEFLCLALTGKDGIDNGLGADSVDVAEDMLELEVHFGEGFLDELELFCRIANHLCAVAHEETQGHDPERGAEGFAEQPGGMELLEPLGVADVGLLARNAFHMASVDQIHLDTRFGQDIVKGDPVVAGAFHGGGLDPTF